MTEFIIVGQGLAANVLMHTFYTHGVSFKVVGNSSLSSCSQVAAGIWNPVVFKRMTRSWLADDLIPHLASFYTGCEQRLHKNVLTWRPILKPFVEEQEKTLWIRKSKAELENYLDATVHSDAPPYLAHCQVPNGYGRVNRCGNLDVPAFLDHSTLFFKEQLISETFQHSNLKLSSDGVRYKDLSAKNVIFCEGHLVSKNPWFNWVPLKPAKGETLTLEIPGLQFKEMIFNKNGFLMDKADGLYKMGATYEWQHLSDDPTPAGLAELTSKLEQMISCKYTLRKQEAGIRPSSVDRRPIIGKHPYHQNLFIFNGLGTKGVMLAPFFANNFVNFYLQKEKLNAEVDASRFYHLYETGKA